MGGWWRWALVSPDGVAPSRIVGVSASVNLPLHHMYVSFGQVSSLLWTHTLRPFYSRPIALTQEGKSLVNDVCVTEG